MQDKFRKPLNYNLECNNDQSQLLKLLDITLIGNLTIDRELDNDRLTTSEHTDQF